MIASCLLFYNPNRFKFSQGQELLSIFVSFLIARLCSETAMALQPHSLASRHSATKVVYWILVDKL